jgi:hypothetical protein
MTAIEDIAKLMTCRLTFIYLFNVHCVPKLMRTFNNFQNILINLFWTIFRQF